MTTTDPNSLTMMSVPAENASSSRNSTSDQTESLNSETDGANSQAAREEEEAAIAKRSTGLEYQEGREEEQQRGSSIEEEHTATMTSDDGAPRPGLGGSDSADDTAEMKPLMVEEDEEEDWRKSRTDVPLGGADGPVDATDRSDFWVQAIKFAFCFGGLQASYLTWGYLQEVMMTTEFEPTKSATEGRFPSAGFLVFANRLLALIVAIIAVRVKHGAILERNVAPLIWFIPCAISNTVSSWSQYGSLRYVSFPVQTVFKSSKIIPVMIMGKLLKGTTYPFSQYIEAALITVGVAIFSVVSKKSSEDSDNAANTELIGLLCMTLYVTFDCFTSQWQDKIYVKYGRTNVDQYQMMLGVSTSAVCLTTVGLLTTGDFPRVYEFFRVNPSALAYCIITAVTSSSGQLFIFYTIKEFGPIVFTIIMTTRQMFSICISSIVFHHPMVPEALGGAVLVFGVLFYQIRRKYLARRRMSSSS